VESAAYHVPPGTLQPALYRTFRGEKKGPLKRARKLPQRLSREEITSLLAQPNRRYPTGIRDRALIRLCVRTGLRCAEALALRPRDLVLPRHEVRVNAGKGDKDRIVWMDETTVEYLARWRDVRPAGEFFFCTLKGTPMRDRDVRAMMARRGIKAGISIPVHPHLLRHTFASTFLEDGGTEVELQALLGHSDPRTTRIYTHLANERLRQLLIDRPG
jgi:integrase/recombinase XerD